MKTLQNYIDTYRSIANNLNLTGDSVEILVQLLANASYINEVENISYVQEASLETATLENSKIQHCMNNMYSVFRGNCPRVIIRFKPTSYLSFNMFDKIVSSNNFNIYYLGYYDGSNEVTEERRMPVESGFKYSSTIIPPDNEERIIIGLIANETVSDSWVINLNNKYYVESSGTDLSNDVMVKISGEDYTKKVTRTFSDHIMDEKIFDLTTTDYGSRLYLATLDAGEENLVTTNINVEATYFKFSKLSDYNESELKKIKIKGAELVNFGEEFLEARGYTELEKGIIVLEENSRDDITSIHYKASRDRYMNSIIRSNSDLGSMLEESFPEKIRQNGTSCVYSDTDFLSIYYVPKSEDNLLTNAEIGDFLDLRLPYFLVSNRNNIKIRKGNRINVRFNIEAVVSGYDTLELSEEINNILEKYSYKLNIDLDEEKDEIYTLIGKISKILSITKFDIEYLNDLLPNSYFDISANIYTTIKS